MAVETVGGTLCRLIVACILMWPTLGLAGPPQPTEDSTPFTDEGAEASERPRLSIPSVGGLTLGKRGIEYRSSFAVKRQTVPFRVWGGRKSSQPALGIDFEPPMRNGKLRAGAYGSRGEIGFAIRFLY